MPSRKGKLNIDNEKLHLLFHSFFSYDFQLYLTELKRLALSANDDKTRLKAIQIILDRTLGKPVEHISVTTKEEKSVSELWPDLKRLNDDDDT